jgi:hypothetical protein
MQDTIRKTAENAISRAGMEVDFDMATNIVETLPWIDYQEVFEKIEERGKDEGRTEREMEIAQKAFGRVKQGVSLESVSRMLRELEISETVIETARKEAESARVRQSKERFEPER